MFQISTLMDYFYYKSSIYILLILTPNLTYDIFLESYTLIL